MQKEMIIVILIIVAVVIVNAITDNYTEKSVSNINSKLEEICNISRENLSKDISDDMKLNEKMNELDTDWKKINKKLAFYIEHDELEKVDTSIVEIKEYLGLGLYDEAIPEIKKCIFVLEHIKNKGNLQIINLF